MVEGEGTDMNGEPTEVISKHKLYGVSFDATDIVYQQEPGMTPLHVNFFLKPVETMDKSKLYLAVCNHYGWVLVRGSDIFNEWATLAGVDLKGWALELPSLDNPDQPSAE